MLLSLLQTKKTKKFIYAEQNIKNNYFMFNEILKRLNKKCSGVSVGVSLNRCSPLRIGLKVCRLPFHKNAVGPYRNMTIGSILVFYFLELNVNSFLSGNAAIVSTKYFLELLHLVITELFQLVIIGHFLSIFDPQVPNYKVFFKESSRGPFKLLLVDYTPYICDDVVKFLLCLIVIKYPPMYVTECTKPLQSINP